MRFVLALCLLATPALAEGPASRLVTAHRLAELGQADRDPVLLMAAARLMQGLQLAEGRLTAVEPPPPKKAAKPADPKAGAKTPTPSPADLQASATVPDPATATPLPGSLDPAALYETARQLAPEDSALREAIADAASEIPPPPALLTVSAMHQEKGAQSFALALPGGDPVQIGLLRLSGAPAFTLAAPDGTVLCEDASTSPGVLCTVTLPESQTLTLTLTGPGDWLLATP